MSEGAGRPLGAMLGRRGRAAVVAIGLVTLVGAVLTAVPTVVPSVTTEPGRPCDGVTVGALSAGTVPPLQVDACMAVLLADHTTRLGPDAPCDRGGIVAHVGIPERWAASFEAVTDAYRARCG